MEAQSYLNPSLIKFKVSKDKKEIEDFIKNWTKKEQLSSIGHVNDNYFVSLPNVYSIAISKAIERAEQLLKLNVKMGYEWIIGRNWAECH